MENTAITTTVPAVEAENTAIIEALSSDEKTAYVAAGSTDATLANYEGEAVKITRNQLLEMVQAVSGCTFISAKTNTIPKMNKTNNPYFGLVVKETVATYLCGVNWKAAIDRLLVKLGGQPNYAIGERANGTVTIDKKVATDKTGEKFYLNVSPRSYQSVRFVGLDGAEIPEAEIAPYLAKSAPAKLNAWGIDEATLASIGIKSLPKYLTISVGNINRVKFGGVVYEIIS